MVLPMLDSIFGPGDNSPNRNFDTGNMAGPMEIIVRTVYISCSHCLCFFRWIVVVVEASEKRGTVMR